jgi:hypothetical protein
LFCFKEKQKEFMSKSNFLFRADVFPFGLIPILISTPSRWRWGHADAVWAFGGARRRGASEHARPLWTNGSDLGASD